VGSPRLAYFTTSNGKNKINNVVYRVIEK